MSLFHAFFLVALFSFGTTAGPISISGKVVYPDSVALEGALVRLSSGEVQDVTNEYGRFHLNQSSGVFHRTKPETPLFTIRNSRMTVSVLENQSMVTLALVDLQGRKSVLLRRRLSQGTHTIDLAPSLSPIASGTRLFSFQMGKLVYTGRVTVLDGNLTGTGRITVGISKQHGPVAKHSNQEKLIISKAGMITREVDLDSLNVDVGTIVMVRDTNSYAMRISDFEGSYDSESKKIHLSWTPPEEPVDFYRIYRAPWTTEFSTGKLQSHGARRFVHSDSTAYTDPIGLELITYAYAARSCRIAGKDTICGILSEIDTVQVTAGFSFSINDGDIYTVRPDVVLQVRDLEGKTDSVFFTQEYTRYLVRNGGEKIEFNYVYPDVLPTEIKMEELLSGGWIGSDGDLASGVSILDIPRFDASDTGNAVTAREIRESTLTQPWRLRDGNGIKKVWCRFAFHDETVDTALDVIRIAPYGNNNYVRLRPANSSAGESRSMIESPNSNFCLYRPWVRFTVSLFGDTTFDDEFSYWIAVLDGRNAASPFFARDGINRSREWLETKARRARLKNAESPQIYTYMLDPDSLRSTGEIDTLSALRHTFGRPGLPFFHGRRLEPSEIIDMRAAPGSFWGANPLGLRGFGREFESLQDTVTASPDSILSLLTFLAESHAYFSGKKEFYLFALLQGKYFGDKRLAMLYGKDFDFYPENTRAFFDFWPPCLKTPDVEPDFFNNGARLGNSFKLRFESVEDRGEARIEKIEYVIARKPENLIWNASETPFQLTPADLLSFNGNGVFPYQIMESEYQIDDVSWEIDASNWPTGEYIMGIVTADEFGNEGFAPIGTERDNVSNPWMVTVETEVND